jgi:hypothetical protein
MLKMDERELVRNGVDPVRVREAWDRIKTALRLVRREGISARLNYQCCQTCGHSAMEHTVKAQKWVFAHKQDVERFCKDGIINFAFCVKETTDPEKDADAQMRVGKTLVGALRTAGLKVEWDGDTGTRPEVVVSPTLPVVKKGAR